MMDDGGANLEFLRRTLSLNLNFIRWKIKNQRSTNVNRMSTDFLRMILSISSKAIRPLREEEGANASWSGDET